MQKKLAGDRVTKAFHLSLFVLFLTFLLLFSPPIFLPRENVGCSRKMGERVEIFTTPAVVVHHRCLHFFFHVQDRQCFNLLALVGGKESFIFFFFYQQADYTLALCFNNWPLPPLLGESIICDARLIFSCWWWHCTILQQQKFCNNTVHTQLWKYVCHDPKKPSKSCLNLMILFTIRGVSQTRQRKPRISCNYETRMFGYLAIFCACGISCFLWSKADGISEISRVYFNILYLNARASN